MIDPQKSSARCPRIVSIIPNVGAVTHTENAVDLLQRGTDVTAFGGKFGYSSGCGNGFLIMTIHPPEYSRYEPLVSEKTSRRMAE